VEQELAGHHHGTHLADEHYRDCTDVHLKMPGGHPGDALLMQAAGDLKRRFSIGHTTIQVEVSRETVCSLAPDEIV
jgi:hypothetical protein